MEEVLRTISLHASPSQGVMIALVPVDQHQPTLFNSPKRNPSQLSLHSSQSLLCMCSHSSVLCSHRSLKVSAVSMCTGSFLLTVMTWHFHCPQNVDKSSQVSIWPIIPGYFESACKNSSKGLLYGIWVGPSKLLWPINFACLNHEILLLTYNNRHHYCNL